MYRIIGISFVELFYLAMPGIHTKSCEIITLKEILYIVSMNKAGYSIPSDAMRIEMKEGFTQVLGVIEAACCVEWAPCNFIYLPGDRENIVSLENRTTLTIQFVKRVLIWQSRVVGLISSCQIPTDSILRIELYKRRIIVL